MTDGLGNISGARLSLRSDHRSALGDAAQSLAQVRRPTHEGDAKGPLIDVIGVVSRAKHFRLIDKVHLEGLEHLGLDEVADPGFGHDRDGDSLDDALDKVGVAHPCHATLSSDIGRDSFQGHNGTSSGILGDLRLLGGDDVHDDATLEHVGQSTLDSCRSSAIRCRDVFTHGPHEIHDCGS